VLDLQGIAKHFGGVHAVDGVDLTVKRGEILGLIGPNGSGKSTIINLVSGLFPLTSGRILFDGDDISDLPSHARVGLGIARTFQNIRLFGQLSVWQNLWVAQNSHLQRQEMFFKRWFGGSAGVQAEIERILEFCAQAPRARRQSLLRRAAAAGIRPRAFRQTQPPAARRAGSGHECRGGGSARCPHPQDAR
jgi:branched-chain amino acid transport system ATP-binding protein